MHRDWWGNAMLLISENIKNLFSTLAATYGAAWDRSCGITPMDQVQAIWQERLKGFSFADIRYALDHLPSKAPNVFEFRDLCRAAPQKQQPQLEAPVADPSKVAEVVSQVKSRMSKFPQRDPKQWARDLKARYDKGEKLGAHQIVAFRQALGHEGRQSWQ